ncbi:hypothetical protein E2C01_033538 [Portunus trituberculatus]|uniref:Uncharacterized protein n=1 Tax=Portunus trituberculatus TaxID=210409 RepID=A0A5B7F2Q1_PORTR|nr:hypothetical protein [Portunus trituberculatus]
MCISSKLPAFIRSRADPPPRYSMMIQSLVPGEHNVEGRENNGMSRPGAAQHIRDTVASDALHCENPNSEK